MGRPTDYGEDVVIRLCERIAGGESVRTISRDEDMPSMATVFRWLAAHPEFREQYARAKEMQAEAFAEELMDIADDGSNDWMEIHHGDDSEDVGWKVNGENIQRSRLRVDTRKWVASKLLAKKYGDKIQNEVSGPDGGAIEAAITVKFVSSTANGS